MSRMYLELNEQPENGGVRVSILGELDLASVPALEDRLSMLRRQKQPVRLDLSKLEFIDSSGIQMLLRTVRASREEGWGFEVESELSHQVQRVLALTNLKEMILSDGRGRR